MATTNSEDDAADSRDTGRRSAPKTGGTSPGTTSRGSATRPPHGDGARGVPTGTTGATGQLSPSRYAVTYAYNGYLRGAHGNATATITETASTMQSEGIDIEFLGATLVVDADGQLVEVTARYSAPSRGTIARLNCRACLPACGPPQATARPPAEREGRGTVAPIAHE